MFLNTRRRKDRPLMIYEEQVESILGNLRMTPPSCHPQNARPDLRAAQGHTVHLGYAS